MLAPQVQVTLIESNQKKATFLRELIYQLDLKNAKVFNDRGRAVRRDCGRGYHAGRGEV